MTAVSPAKITKWQIATAAEAYAAARFARMGFNVSVQYGANQPEYDLMIDKGGRILKISVKGSTDGSWGLTQTQLSALKSANYHGAADAWLSRHRRGTVLCLVQFEGTSADEMPRMYLASPEDVAHRLRAAASGRGDSILFEKRTRGTKATGAGTEERIPDEWRLNEERVEQLLRSLALDEATDANLGSD